MKMEDWNADLLLHVIQYLNVTDMAAFSRQSRRMYYLIQQYRILRGPQLVTVASYYDKDNPPMSTDNGENNSSVSGEQYTAMEIYDQAISKLQGPPTLALSFTTIHELQRDDSDIESNSSQLILHQVLQNRNPCDTVVLGSIADSIQTTGIQHSRYTSSKQNVDAVCNGTSSQILPQYESQSNNALMMLAGLPSDTIIQPFFIPCDEVRTAVEAEEIATRTFCHHESWKMFILYVVGDGVGIADAFIRTIQDRYPKVTIVGGICSAAYVSRPNTNDTIFESFELFESAYSKFNKNELIQLNQQMGGQPISNIRKMSRKKVAEFLYNTYFKRRRCVLDLLNMGDSPYADGICGVALEGDVPVRSLVSRGVESLTSKYFGGNGIPTPSTTLYVHEAEIVREDDEGYLLSGLRFAHHDGFPLESPHPISVRLNAFLMISSTSIDEDTTLVGANVDFFDLSGKQCIRDMEYCMDQLRLQTTGEEILGAIMFSCNGRGPEAGMFITEEMADAKRFANVFPSVPCLGFYAGGEIGPLALAGRQSVFQQGSACVQGFTAVFALFIVPKFNWEKTRGLDDSPSCIENFIQNRLR